MLKLPIRPPVLVAKQAASVAALSGNRLGLGVGISPWPDGSEIFDVPFEKRGKRMDECLDIVRGLTAWGYFEFHGEFYDLSPIKISPVPPNRSRCSSAGWPDAQSSRSCAGGVPAGRREWPL